jgi:hypothetical protein
VRRPARWGALGAVLVVSRVSSAEPSPAGPEHAPPENGFYLRLSLGAGLLDLDRTTSRSGPGPSYLYLGDDSTIRGLAAATELSVGATVAPGLVVAGTWLGLARPGADIELIDGTRAALEGSVSSFFLGPTVDLYPTRTGVHFGGGAGYLAYAGSALEPPGSIGGAGAGVVLGAGYDFWLDAEWAVGIAARGLLGQVGGTHASASVTGEERTTVLFAGVLASVLLY